MKRLSFIFNSERPLRRFAVALLAMVALMFAADRVAFRLFFPLYNQWLRAGSAMGDSQIMLVGSSHIQADVDIKLLRQLTGKTVGLFSVPGVSLIGRSYAIAQRFRLKNIPKPTVVVLEASKLVLHPYRYNDDVAEYLVAYTHYGLFEDFVNLYVPKHPDHIWLKIFETYSLNGAFSKFTDPSNLVRFVTENWLSNENYIHFRSIVRGRHVSCLDPPPADDPRLATWKDTDRKNQYDNRIDPRRVDELKQILAMTRQEGVKLILLVPPFYHFKDQGPDDGFNNVRAKLRDMETENVKYLALTVPNESCLFNDEGHLNSEGQEIFTKSLADFLKTSY